MERAREIRKERKRESERKEEWMKKRMKEEEKKKKWEMLRIDVRIIICHFLFFPKKKIKIKINRITSYSFFHNSTLFHLFSIHGKIFHLFQKIYLCFSLVKFNPKDDIDFSVEFYYVSSKRFCAKITYSVRLCTDTCAHI